jgi:hypothetical protein
MTKDEIKKAAEAKGDKLTWYEFVYCIQNGIHASNVDKILIDALGRK